MSRFTRRGIALALVVVVSTVVASVAFAGASGAIELQALDADPVATGGGMQVEESPFWFVEFPTAPLADGSAPANVADDAAAFRAEASAEGAAFTERMRFQTLWNGMSIEASAASLSKIEKFASVKAVYPVGIHRVPETRQGVSPDLATALAQTGADVAQNTLGLTGKGVKVAVMDSGVDYHHPDLGGGFGKGKRVFTGFDFVGENYVGDNTPVPDKDPDDCKRPEGGNAAGHGTHVAGIIGANGGVKGVAPGIRYGAYRVFGCQGFTTDDIMIAAMERILKDDMDVLNMSIGDAFNNWPDSPTAAASDRLVRKGVVVVASIGNSQNSGNPPTMGLFAAGAPGVGEHVIGTASFENTHVALTTINVTPAGVTAGYANAAGAPTAPTTGSLPLAKTGTPTTVNDACAPASLGDLTGKAVLIRRGTCGFYEKARRAQLAGAAAVLLYNNVAGRISPTVAVVAGIADEQPVTIPTVAISDTEGVAINNAIDSGAQTLNWTNVTGSFPNPTANLLSSFTSYGVAADLSLKPDIGAPGGLIRSTYPIEYGSYTTISGTSMASPHVAGAAALLLQSWNGKHGDDDDDDDNGGDRAKLVRDIFQNSADPKLWSGNPGLGFLEIVARQGAGMIDIDDSILAKTLVTPGKLSLGESQAGAVTKTLKIENNGKSNVTYNLSFVGAISPGPGTTPTTNNYPFTFGNFLGTDVVTFSKPSVTVKRRDSERVKVTISPDPTLPDKTLYGGYIVIVPSDGSPTLRVPYSGFKGDYQSLTVLSSAFGLPLITDENLDDHVGAWSLVDAANRPNVAYQLIHQARSLDILVVRNSDGAVLGRAAELERLARNGNPGLVFLFSWDGTYLQGTKGNKLRVAADGDYRLRLVAEKPLASKNNPAHFETQTSPVFTIDRP
jgi:minor extracellular serine protease Vpr